MHQMTLAEFHRIVLQQKVEPLYLQFVCPRCHTVQCADDFIKAGVGESFSEVEPYLAFSCIGRWDESKGCDWTLGGLFQIHELVVTTPDGTRHPRFRPANIPVSK